MKTHDAPLPHNYQHVFTIPDAYDIVWANDVTTNTCVRQLRNGLVHIAIKNRMALGPGNTTESPNRSHEVLIEMMRRSITPTNDKQT